MNSIQPSPGNRWRGIIHEYRQYLPVSDTTPIVSLNEGNTQLVRADNFVEAIGGNCQLRLKYEGINPTGSFKDRGMTMARDSKAVERGTKAVVCASTGNTCASAAAYAARASIDVHRIASRVAKSHWASSPRPSCTAQGHRHRRQFR